MRSKIIVDPQPHEDYRYPGSLSGRFFYRPFFEIPSEARRPYCKYGCRRSEDGEEFKDTIHYSMGFRHWRRSVVRLYHPPRNSKNCIYQAHYSCSAPPAVTAPTIVSGDLKIINFRFTESKDGPLRPESPYKPGDKVYTDYNVTGFTTDQEGKGHLLITLTVLDPAGIPLYPPYKHELHEALPKPDEPVSGYFNFDLHPYVPSGKFNIQIKVHDSVKNTDSEFIRSFSVEGGATETSSRLEYRNFQFSLFDGGSPVINPVIQVGERIYSQCIIAGMQFREDRPDVVIGLKIIGPKGETIIENPELIKISDSYFYHPITFFERISAHASLPSNAPRGRYTWKYTMTDRIANAKVDYKGNFEGK